MANCSGAGERDQVTLSLAATGNDQRRPGRSSLTPFLILDRKGETRGLFADTPIIAAVVAPIADKLTELPVSVVAYRTRLKINPTLERLDAFRTR